jgi:hypothetical protein
VSLDSLVEARYIERYKPQRRPTCVQVPYMSKTLDYLVDLAVAADGRMFVRLTRPQVARAIGLAPKDMGAKMIDRKYARQISNTLKYLERAEFIECSEPIYRGKEPDGLKVWLAPGTVDEVRRCRRRDSNPRHADYDSAALTS